MMHEARLPESNRRRLRDILFLQMRLLRWAAQETDITQQSCEAWLSRRPRLATYAHAIAGWIWASERRYGPLEGFAAGPHEAKDKWSQALAFEACVLLRQPGGSLTAFDEAEAEPWQKSGAQFLRQFYDDLRGGRFPASLFGGRTSSSFGAQEFLRSFLEANNDLCVCPACDESLFIATIRSEVRTEIDHYFPKSRYPHLACHPHNLVPLCHLCNAWSKGSRDPLATAQGPRRALSEVFLPYREAGLSSRTFAHVILSPASRMAQFRELRARSGNVLQDRIAVMAELYDIPQRWTEHADIIGEKLFRRMRQYFIYGPAYGEEADNVMEGIRAGLEGLIALFYDQDLAREVYAYPMVWWLSKLVEEELQSADSPLVREIMSWGELPEGTGGRLARRGREVREMTA